jgi:hypothetical protein
MPEAVVSMAAEPAVAERAVWQSLRVSARGTRDDDGAQDAKRGVSPGTPAQVAG